MSAPAPRSRSSCRASTTNSLARTGSETAARTSRRSSTEPPNQWGSHSTEMAAAPPAAYARARATASSPAAMAPADGDRRLTSAIRWRPGPASSSAIGRGAGAADDRAGQPGATERVQPGPDVGQAACGDLADHVPAARVRSPLRDRHAGAPAATSAARRSARSRPSSSDVRPASMVSAARSMPASIVGTTPAATSAAPALSSTTSRRAPGSPRSTPSTRAALAAGSLPPSAVVFACLEAQRLRIDLAPLDPLGGHVVDHAGPVERQLVDTGAVDDQRALGPQQPEDLRDPAVRRPHRRPRSAPASPRPGWSSGRAD